MKSKLIEILKVWLIAAIAILAFIAAMASTGDYDDRMIDETVKEEAVAQAIEESKREAMALRAKKIELAERATYMTGFAMVQK